MSDDLLLGIDCGATKVMAQSGILCPKTNKISPGSFHKEYLYSDHPDWNPQFDPVPIATQKIEYSSHNISLTQSEIKQGRVITETILKAIEENQDHKIGLCFPGLKDQNGILVMANGPRIPDLKNRLKKIESILNDSDCCVMGEWKSTIGQMQNIDNGIYIGGGTGIADGMIFNGELLRLNDLKGVQRSWEIHIDPRNTVESLLSPAGMINNYNKNHKTKITSLATLSNQKTFNVILEKALNASVIIGKQINKNPYSKLTLGYMSNSGQATCQTIPSFLERQGFCLTFYVASLLFFSAVCSLSTTPKSAGASFRKRH